MKSSMITQILNLDELLRYAAPETADEQILFNAVQEAHQEAAAKDREIEELEGSISDLEEFVSEKEDEIANLEARIVELEAEAEASQDHVDSLLAEHLDKGEL